MHISTEIQRNPDRSLPSILLVDDEEDTLPEYQFFFELEGYHSLICARPEEAAGLVLQYPSIRLVITDQRMAGMDGMSLIRKLKASVPAGRRLSFFLMTGDITHVPASDMSDVPVFFKPPDTDALLAAVRSVLGTAA